MMGKPKLSDYLGWKLRVKLRIAQAILAAHWNAIFFCQRMRWRWAEYALCYRVIARWPLNWADRIWLTAHAQCWLRRAIRQELFTVPSPVGGRRTNDTQAAQRQKG